MKNNKIKIAIVVNNYGEAYDGVGAYSKVIASNFSDNIDINVFTAKCFGNASILKKFFSFEMSKEFYLVSRSIKQYDTVLIEYPFVEWNPLIIVLFRILCIKAHRLNKRIILSLHEYTRVNKLRKIVIRSMVKKADLILVSDETFRKALLKYSSNIMVRNIPTNIYSRNFKEKEKSTNNYVFFGLINGAKAFDSMIDGWKLFNRNGKFKLYIISATKIDESQIRDFELSNISYIYKAEEDKIMEIMQSCAFCILPIKPNIDNKNATFKTASLAGCICIGKFSEEFKDLSFTINMDSYKTEEFKLALCATRKLNEQELKDEFYKAREFGKNFTPHIIAETIESCIKEEINIGRK